MLTFQPIASSSRGNAYRVTDGETSLLIEAGVNYREIQKAFNFKVSEVAACLISHEHMDHAKAIQDVLRAGVPVYMTKGTQEALGIRHHRLKIIESLKEFTVGPWRVLPFETEHDAAEPVGFLIMSAAGERLLFATDTYFIRYRFQGLNIIAVECNYSDEILKQNILEGNVPLVMRKRLARSHFSLEDVLEFFAANDLQDVREIWLLHLSDNNSDAELFKGEVMKVTGKPVYIAES